VPFVGGNVENKLRAASSSLLQTTTPKPVGNDDGQRQQNGTTCNHRSNGSRLPARRPGYCYHKVFAFKYIVLTRSRASHSAQTGAGGSDTGRFPSNYQPPLATDPCCCQPLAASPPVSFQTTGRSPPHKHTEQRLKVEKVVPIIPSCYE